MRAIRVLEHGGPDVLRVEEVPVPQPGAGELRVRIDAAGVNFVDVYNREGLYRSPLPYTPGDEAAGTVDAMGSDVTGFRVGDRVAYYAGGTGSYAEYAVIPAAKAVAVPEAVSLHQAAAVLLQGMTAHYLSHSCYPLGPHDMALIHAAAGGTGRLLVQMAKRRGAFVIGTTSTEEKARLAREAGADEVILYTKADFAAETRRLTGGAGVNVVYDSVGKATFDKSLDCLKRRGYLVLFGQSSGPVPPVDPQILNRKGSLYLTRPTLGHYVAERAELLERARDLFNWIAAGELAVRIDKVFPLEQAAAAQQYLEDRLSTGKVLLVP